jgi:alkanesulfonate monooxygenase SsuD/methylene tetrahydromethanopterin reductase-like flavin-dependent oxidoreductase (luciferase family)
MSTPRRFRFAVQGGPFGEAAVLRDHARRVQDLGYDEFYTSDHVGSPGSEGRQDGRSIVDPFLPLMVAAAATDRLRVGPLVLNNELYNPALLARTAATADRVTDGRLVLGLGAGYTAAEHAAIGSPIRPPGPRRGMDVCQ